MKKFFLIFALAASSVRAATWYVDNTASGTGSGTSWANACTTVQAMVGKSIGSGDTIQISGGASGGSQTYSTTTNPTYSGQFLVPDNTTWIIGQDTSHNGTVIWDAQGTGAWLQHNYTGVTVSGKYLTGSDGIRHFKLKDNTTTDGVGSCGNSINVHFEYIDFGSQPGNAGQAALDFNPASNGVEVDHCICVITGDSADKFSYGQFTGTGYDQNKFHDNVITVPYSPTTFGYGADGLVWVGSTNSTGGFSIYNNVFISALSATYTGSQHADGFQGAGGSYIKIYNNRFTDFGDYDIFPEGYTVGATYSHVRIYNNVAVMTKTGSAGQSIAISASPTYPITDVVCANNVADGRGNPFTFRYSGSPGNNPTAFVTCYFYNNVDVNTTGAGNIIDLAVTAANNVSVSASNAHSYYTSWTSAGSGTNTPSNANYVLLSAATPLIHTGTDVSSYGITTDFAGTSYASPPSVGPYEYGGGGDTTPPVVTITAPTSSPTYSTSTSPLTSLAGTASDDVALSSVTWSNSAGGSGTATGTTSWSVASIILSSGSNVITVTATDTSSNTSTDTLTITYTPPATATPTNYRKARTLAGGF